MYKLYKFINFNFEYLILYYNFEKKQNYGLPPKNVFEEIC